MARLKFKIDSMMTPTIQRNFPSDPKYAANHWICLDCVEPPVSGSVPGSGYTRVDTQSHVTVCRAHVDLRYGKDLTQDRDIVEYFASVIERWQNRN